MQNELNELLTKAKELLKDEMTKISYETWIKNLEIQSFDNDIVVLVASSGFQKESIQSRYYDLLTNTFNFITNKDCQINIISKDELQEEEAINLPNDVGYGYSNSTLNPKYTFDTFVVGNNNRFAHAAALAVAEAPATSYNPLFIYGGVGLGKTHLMHAIGNAILRKNKKANILYVTSEKFTNQLINSIKDNTSAQFRDKYRNIDVLIIDDIQFLGGATQTQQEFFHTFNTLYSDSKQIIISSDRSPDDLKLLEDRLRTRFCWGLTVNIFPPDFNLRVEIIKRKIIAGNFEKEISEDVIEYIASNMGSDVRQLEGSITRLVAYSAIMGGSEINLELAIEALKDFISKGISEKNDVHRIQKVVAEYFQISVEDIRSKKRSSNIAFPRQIAMYLCRKLTSESFPKIGTEFGGKDHSTVMHSVEKIENEIKVNPDLANIIEKIKEDIQ